jgi:ribosome biogenesis ATPase
MSSLGNLSEADRRKVKKRRNTGNKTLERRIMGYVDTLGPKEPVSLSDVNASLRSKFYDYGRLPESKLKKEIEKTIETIVNSTGGKTNSNRKYYIKSDFYPCTEPQNEKENDKEEKPQQAVEIFDTDEGLMMNVKVPPNALNTMLPAIKAKEEKLTKNEDALSEKTEKSENKLSGVKRKREEVSEKGENKRQKTMQSTFLNKKSYQLTSDKRYSDMGGISDIIEEIKRLVEFPLKHPMVFEYLGCTPPRGILICGQPGSGKTALAHSICGEMNVPFYKLSGPELVSSLSGESEQNIRDIFKEVEENAPSILFIDEIDSISGKREQSQKDLEKRIVAQLISSIDDLENSRKPVVVIGATSRPEYMDTTLRRAGRFDREITLKVPDEKGRLEIMNAIAKNMRIANKESFFKELSRLTPGYVPADLFTLCKEASISAISRIYEEFFDEANQKQAERKEEVDPNESTENKELKEMKLEIAEIRDEISKMSHSEEPIEEEIDAKIQERIDLDKKLQGISIEESDFMIALKKVQPTAQREGFTTIPNVSWEDVGALSKIRSELQVSIVDPIRKPEKYEKVGLTAPAGVLLFGPPGCGKTLVAKAVSHESKANFISIKGPELLNKYVGESEKAVRQLFARARASSP